MRRSKLWLLLVTLGIILPLTACAPKPKPAASTPVEATPTPKPVEATPTPAPPTPTPAPATGSVQGVLTGSKSSQPIADAYVLLCAVVDPTASEPECLLRADLSTVTDTDGSFTFESVSPGTYIVVYGLSDEVQGSPQTWDGRSVRYRSPVTVDPFGGNQGASFPKGTEIDVAGDGIYVNTGSFTSNEFGLSIEYRQHEPLGISVTAGQTAQVTVDVSGH